AQTADNRARVRLKSWRRSQASAKVPFVLLQADVARIHVIRATFLFAPEVSAGDSPDCVSASPLVVPAPLSGTYLSVGGQSRRRRSSLSNPRQMGYRAVPSMGRKSWRRVSHRSRCAATGLRAFGRVLSSAHRAGEFSS